MTRRDIQLLQLNEYEETSVVQCKIVIHRHVINCGNIASYYASVLHSGMEYLYEIGRERCHDIYKTGTFHFDSSHLFREIKVNFTTTRPVLYAVKLDSGGGCSGTAYSDAYGSWTEVFVQGTVKITVQEHIATVDLNNNYIKLRSGTRCTLSKQSCIDIEGGYRFWEAMPRDICEFSQDGLLSKVMQAKYRQHI